MCGSKDGLTIRQIHRIAAFRHRVVLCEACRPTATHLFPADSLWRYVHLGVDEDGYWCALPPRTTQGEGTVNAIAVAIEGTVLEYPSDILGSGRNSSIAAFHLTQFHTIEVSKHHPRSSTHHSGCCWSRCPDSRRGRYSCRRSWSICHERPGYVPVCR